MTFHDIFGDRMDDLEEDKVDQAWMVQEIGEHIKKDILEEVEKVDRKVESTISTGGRLMENEEFRELEEDKRTIIWELVKIRENDSPKNQTKVAEQYDVTDAYLSKLKQKIDKLGV